MSLNRYIVTLEEKKLLAREVWKLTFSRPLDFVYQPGQFCQFFIENDGVEVARFYSFASTPTEDSLQFIVKFVPAGLGSRYFAGLNIGDKAKIGPAMGKFTVPAEFAGLTMIATGVGLAPFTGFIKENLKFKNISNKLRLLFGARSEADLFWQDELKDFAAKYPNFSFITTLSQPTDGIAWHGQEGRVTAHLAPFINAEDHFFVCGSPAMITDVRKILVESKIEPKKIHLEAF
ncbi:MAG: FAD-dependent oxidoreductase [Patescibacteria group bacterium]